MININQSKKILIEFSILLILFSVGRISERESFVQNSQTKKPSEEGFLKLEPKTFEPEISILSLYNSVFY
ncbi:hypothetical protein CH361_04210 [Leptospira brenneri]|nr:hypothetical protein CH361_04210 [Leptospira brenneri]